MPPKNLITAWACLLVATGTGIAQRADSVVTFNEVHYHPAVESAPEWVELHNQMSVRVDLSGWRLSAGVDFAFPEGSVMEPGGYWVVASDPEHPSLGGVSMVFGPFTGKLDNGGETLRLRGRHGRVMDEFDYRDGGSWPTAPDGGGVTLAKRMPESASGRAENWTWSDEPGGTPGGANFVTQSGEVQTEVVGLETVWGVDTSGRDLDPSWRLLAFDDSSWMKGSGKFATALVQNPSFEAESFSASPGYVSANSPITAWQTFEGGVPGGASWMGINSPGGLDAFSNNGATPHGSNVAFIRGGMRALVQEVRGLLPGSRYLLSYRENARSPTRPVGRASLDALEVVPEHMVAAVDSLGLHVQPYHHQVGVVFRAEAPIHRLSLGNEGAASDTILYDAARLDRVSVFYEGAGAAAVHRAFPDAGEVVLLRVEVDPGSGGRGVRVGFKNTDGREDLTTHGVLWLEVEGNGDVVLRADEQGGDHIVSFAAGVEVQLGLPNRVAMIWQRAAGLVSVVINENTVFNEVNLNAIAGGADGVFRPSVAGVGALFSSAGGSLTELAVASGPRFDTVLPIPARGSLYRFRTEFESAADGSGSALLLNLQAEGLATVFLNGVEILQEAGNARADLLLSGEALRAGPNSLAVELTPIDGAADLALELGLTTIQGGTDRRASPLRLNEIAPAGAPGFFVEIANDGPRAVSLGGHSLNSFALPDSILAPGEVRAFTGAELGFAPADEEILFLREASGSVLDAERVENRLRAYDRESSSWQHPDGATPGESNSFAFDRRIVINEIHYHNRPIYADPITGIDFEEIDLEWLELHNRSDSSVDLTGWSLRDGIRYDFPAGTVLGPGEFLVVTGAEFDGALNNRSDRIHLRDNNDNTVDVVEYFDDDPWSRNADGRGASLELIHPDAENAVSASWRASEESGRSEWRSYRYRGRGTEPAGNNNPGFFHEFLMGMLASGEVLIDDLSVLEDPIGAAIELIQNGDFESDPAGMLPSRWRILGNHRSSHVVELPEGGKALKLVATGPLEHSYNVASTTFARRRTIGPGKTYEISFRAKWVSGSPQLNTRLYFNRLARTHILPQPEVSGTPGAPNSVILSEAPPLVTDLRHAPLVPEAGESIRIHARLAGPGGIASAAVHYDAGSEWEVAAMSESAEDSYVAVLPGQLAGTVVQFYIEAIANSGAETIYPPTGADSRALFRVGDRRTRERDVPTMRLIIRPEEAEFMHTAHHTPSNHRFGATVIYDDREFWYDAGVRLRGSPYGRRGSRVGWNVKFPADRPFRGVHQTVAIDGGFSVPRGDGSGWVQVGPGVATNELIYNQMAHRAGAVPASHDDVIYVEAPRPGDDKLAQLKMARFGDIWKASSFDNGDEGTSFKFELIYHPRTTVDGRPDSLKSVYDAVLGVDIREMGNDKEAYRHNFWIQNHRDRDDYGPVVSAGRAFGANSANLRAATEEALDVDNWLRVMAYQALTMTLDSYNNGLAHNMLLYNRPSDGKTMWIPWDVDHAFYASPTSSIFGLANANFARVVQIPANRRAYCGHLLDLCTTGFDPSYVADWVTHFNEVGEMPIARHYTQWIAERRSHVLSQLRALHPAQTFRITTNGGDDFSTDDSQVVLRGRGWIDVREIHLESSGEPLAVHWLDNDDWEVVVPVSRGENSLVLIALDHSGSEVGRDEVTVTNSGTVEPASSSNLVISEIMYHPADPTPGERDAGFTNDGVFEYLELQNIGSATIDLRGASFTEGVAFDFSSGGITELAAGERLLLVRNEPAFEMRHGEGLPVAGVFQGDTALANGGERLRLEDAGGGTIRDFRYDDGHPWPVGADGGGYSLVLRSPVRNPDHSLPENWRHSSHPGGNPGLSDSTIFAGEPGSEFLSFALGGTQAGNELSFSSDLGVLAVTHPRNLAADEVRFVLEVSRDLVEWEPSGMVPAAEEPLGNGRSLVSWELPLVGEQWFVRLRVVGD